MLARRAFTVVAGTSRPTSEPRREFFEIEPLTAEFSIASVWEAECDVDGYDCPGLLNHWGEDNPAARPRKHRIYGE